MNATDPAADEGNGPAATVRAYYETLRNGEPLYPFFAVDSSTAKFGITERLTGYEETKEGLRAQTETTADWEVESHDLVVGEREEYAWFADEVRMAWTDVTTGTRHDHRTRWSGTLERVRRNGADDGNGVAGRGSESGSENEGGNGNESRDEEREWRFVSMHVSEPSRA